MVNVKAVRLVDDSPALKQGAYVAIATTDVGIGITGNHLSSVFDPYFTTKKKGSGLGLATSFAIVKKHGGAINVEGPFQAMLPCSTFSLDFH